MCSRTSQSHIRGMSSSFPAFPGPWRDNSRPDRWGEIGFNLKLAVFPVPYTSWLRSFAGCIVSIWFPTPGFALVCGGITGETFWTFSTQGLLPAWTVAAAGSIPNFGDQLNSCWWICWWNGWISWQSHALPWIYMDLCCSKIKWRLKSHLCPPLCSVGFIAWWGERWWRSRWRAKVFWKISTRGLWLWTFLHWHRQME